MISYFKSSDGVLKKLDKKEAGCWVSVQAPTEQEIEYLEKIIGVNSGFIETSLDEKEKSHVEKRSGQLIFIFNMPVESPIGSKGVPEFYTRPIGFVFLDDCVVSIISKQSDIIDNIQNGAIEDLDTENQNQLVFSINYYIAHHFAINLESIDQIAFKIEMELHKSVKNDEMIKILSLQKSLVYFTTSLKSTEATLEKISRGKVRALDEDDSELLDDVLIEIQQSISTASIYTYVFTSTIDVVESIVSNNLNFVMKVLTSLTIVLSIPNMVFGFYGMNVEMHSKYISFELPLLITLVITGIFAFILYINDFF